MVRLWMESRLWLASVWATVTLSRLWLAFISPTIGGEGEIRVLGVVVDHRRRENRRLRLCLVGRLWLAPRM